MYYSGHLLAAGLGSQSSHTSFVEMLPAALLGEDFNTFFCSWGSLEFL